MGESNLCKTMAGAVPSITDIYSLDWSKEYKLLGALSHKRMIKTEEKAKVVAVVWGKEFINFLAVLAFLHSDNLKNRMNCTRMI